MNTCETKAVKSKSASKLTFFRRVQLAKAELDSVTNFFGRMIDSTAALLNAEMPIELRFDPSSNFTSLK